MRKNDDTSIWRLFFRVVDRGSLTKAAEDFQLEPSSVSRQITALEKRLSTQLLNRTTRKISLTCAGMRAYEQMRPLIDEMDYVVANLDVSLPTLHGLVRVSAPVNFGERYVTSWLATFQRLNPGITVDLELSDRALDLMAEGVDVAIRVGHLPVSTLIARRLGTMSHVLCASPGYLAAHGTPLHPHDLPEHKAIIYSWLSERNPTRIALEHKGQVESVELSGCFFLNNVGAIYRAMLDGVGLHAGPRWLFNDSLKSGELVHLLPQWSLPALPVNLVRLKSPFVPDRIVALCDWLAECWEALPCLE
ncbi:LysR family transcriptional regulator [Pseudomonas sp. FW300-N1A1]|uniref:LysR family transcriptional regulator n=1 Tax=Pseudomonas sp. FW300-N1A1 TaxID=2075555 RepID=UPI000CD1124B|nr:LysR family transcriptional regulator [Pseudomonas sp. FW300-N1A1]POA17309.1 LysR family transcriptional regulator [Pseudomonas sp. FW300-N1A1]